MPALVIPHHLVKVGALSTLEGRNVEYTGALDTFFTNHPASASVQGGVGIRPVAQVGAIPCCLRGFGNACVGTRVRGYGSRRVGVAGPELENIVGQFTAKIQPLPGRFGFALRTFPSAGTIPLSLQCRQGGRILPGMNGRSPWGGGRCVNLYLAEIVQRGIQKSGPIPSFRTFKIGAVRMDA
jgi:hypothetical protein